MVYSTEIFRYEQDAPTPWRVMIFNDAGAIIGMRSFHKQIDAESYAKLRVHFLNYQWKLNREKSNDNAR